MDSFNEITNLGTRKRKGNISAEPVSLKRQAIFEGVWLPKAGTFRLFSGTF
jgi:cytoskeletal protein CcmA (bactofilin family)